MTHGCHLSHVHSSIHGVRGGHGTAQKTLGRASSWIRAACLGFVENGSDAIGVGYKWRCCWNGAWRHGEPVEIVVFVMEDGRWHAGLFHFWLVDATFSSRLVFRGILFEFAQRYIVLGGTVGGGLGLVRHRGLAAAGSARYDLSYWELGLDEVWTMLWRGHNVVFLLLVETRSHLFDDFLVHSSLFGGLLGGFLEETILVLGTVFRRLGDKVQTTLRLFRGKVKGTGCWNFGVARAATAWQFLSHWKSGGDCS